MNDNGIPVGGFLVMMFLAFFAGTCVVWGRPVVQKNVTETKCDKTQFQLDVEGGKELCGGYGVESFTYEDNGKGEKISPIIKCKGR